MASSNKPTTPTSTSKLKKSNKSVDFQEPSRCVQFIHISVPSLNLKQVYSTDVTVNIWLNSLNERIPAAINKLFKQRTETIQHQLKTLQLEINSAKEKISLKLAEEAEKQAAAGENNPTAANATAASPNPVPNRSIASTKSKSVSNSTLLPASQANNSAGNNQGSNLASVSSSGNNSTEALTLQEQKSSQSKRIKSRLTAQPAEIEQIPSEDPLQQQLFTAESQFTALSTELAQIQQHLVSLQSPQYSNLDLLDEKGQCLNLRGNLTARVKEFVTGGHNYLVGVALGENENNSNNNGNVQPLQFSFGENKLSSSVSSGKLIKSSA